MVMAILGLHLLVSVCLVGLVLLQRSEGGALGMGGGGGSLMSGRGAADALARMTSIAGGFFLVTSLSLTVISGAAASNRGPSPLDLAPSSEAPASLPAPLPARPDPTESSAPQAGDDTQLAELGAPPSASQPVQVAPPPTQASERAAPPTPASQPARQAPAQTAPPPRRQPPAQAQAVQAQPAVVRPRPAPAGATPPPQRLVIPNTSGSGTPPETAGPPESVQTEPGLQPVRRERAGPDQ
jgi:preprotein translocase subunit SecG